MYLCIDIGGTKTLIAILDANRNILHSSRFPTAFDQNHFFATLVSKINSILPPQKLRAISVAVPGPTEGNHILWLGNLPWTNFDICAKLKKLFNTSIFLENDANLAGLAEAENLPGLSVYLTFSTGIGGGIIRDGRISDPAHIYEPGHDQYEFQGKTLEWEDFASAKAVSEYYGKYTSAITDQSDWQEIASHLAIGLRSLISNIRPDQIIFGGPLGLELKHYKSPLEQQLAPYLSPAVALPKFSTAKYQHKSVIYGCFIYAQQQLANQ